MSILLTCKQATRLVSQALDHPLSTQQNLSLKWHLTYCTGCRRYQQQLKFLRQATQSAQDQAKF